MFPTFLDIQVVEPSQSVSYLGVFSLQLDQQSETFFCFSELHQFLLTDL